VSSRYRRERKRERKKKPADPGLITGERAAPYFTAGWIALQRAGVHQSFITREKRRVLASAFFTEFFWLMAGPNLLPRPLSSGASFQIIKKRFTCVQRDLLLRLTIGPQERFRLYCL